MQPSKEMRDVLTAFEHAILVMEGKVCMRFAELEIEVEDGWPEIFKVHLHHALTSYTSSLVEKNETKSRLEIFTELYDHDAFMAMVDKAVREAIATLITRAKKDGNHTEH